MATIEGSVSGPENLDQGIVYVYAGTHTLEELKAYKTKKKYEAYLRSGAYTMSIPEPGTYTVVCTIHSDNREILPKELREVVTLKKNDSLKLNFEF